ncbi:MAG: hypothetical protein LBB84_01500 [Tannerellaceae bacterium]|jgi:hypothetical protein|nr:hypothetical protein [Tannerellaceae bacterium]
MAKNKKRKKVQTSHHGEISVAKPSKADLEACHAAARRIFRLMGEDETSFDLFSKHQKQAMFRIPVAPPRVRAMPGHKVPKRYIRFIQEQFLLFLKREYFEKEIGIRWIELFTVGQNLMLIFSSNIFLNSLPEPQRRVADNMYKAFRDKELFPKMQDRMLAVIKTLLMMISQPNFRIYGHYIEELRPMEYRHALQPVVYITTNACESIRFRYHNKEHKAFRIAVGQELGTPCLGATIEMNKIYPNVSPNRTLNIYVQSHALHRFKERIDTFFPSLRNQLLVFSLFSSQRVVNGPGGIQLFVCISPSRNEDLAIGYLPFTIDGNNLFILTLLPLLSRNTPEGHVLCNRLRLSTADLKYLGMDKLSFFFEVDIEQIPVLKEILFDELHLDYIRNKLGSMYHAKNNPFNEKKTLFVKNFFQKLEK